MEESEADTFGLHGSRGWGGGTSQSDFDLIVIHDADTGGAEPGAALERTMDRHCRDSFEEQYNLKYGSGVVKLDHYYSPSRTLNHHMARAAWHGLIFPREPGTEDRYRHDDGTSNEWKLVTTGRLQLAAEENLDTATLRKLHRRREWQRSSWSVNSIEGRNAHSALWQSGAALLSILGGLPEETDGGDGPDDGGARWRLEPRVPERPGPARPVRRGVVASWWRRTRSGTCRSCGDAWRLTVMRSGDVSGSCAGTTWRGRRAPVNDRCG